MCYGVKRLFEIDHGDREMYAAFPAEMNQADQEELSTLDHVHDEEDAGGPDTGNVRPFALRSSTKRWTC